MELRGPQQSCFYLAQPASVSNECAKPRTIVFTTVALIAFASNSILCRTALGQGVIDAAGFTIIRLITGALVLWMLSAMASARPAGKSKSSFISGMMLFAYAAAFSFAFVDLNTGTGALILFGSVQATMFLVAVLEKQVPTLSEGIGLVIALIGLGALVFPGLGAPSAWAAALMAAAGISWGFYSLRGRGAVDPMGDTRNNFIRSTPFVLLLGVVAFPTIEFSTTGVLLAVASGVASGLGYIIWYAALQHLNAKHGALVQLTVPVLAATGGVVFLAETVSLRLVFAAVLILGGIGLAIASPWGHRQAAAKQRDY
jgi:drug/metabolite transporter (DMT)-like permease